MTLLFDTTPDEPTKAKKGRRKPAAQESSPSTQVAASVLAYPVDILGKIDGVLECSLCAASAHDVLVEAGREWLVGCAFCGAMQWEKAVKGHLAPKGKEFRFWDGLYAGKTIAEVAGTADGLDYLRWAAERHKNQSVRAACQTHLDTVPAAL